MKTKRTLAIVLVLLMALAFVPAMASALYTAPTFTLSVSGIGITANRLYTLKATDGAGDADKYFELYLADQEKATLTISPNKPLYTFAVTAANSGMLVPGTAPNSYVVTGTTALNKVTIENNDTNIKYIVDVMPVAVVSVKATGGTIKLHDNVTGNNPVTNHAVKNPGNVSWPLTVANSSYTWLFDLDDEVGVELIPNAGYYLSGFYIGGIASTATTFKATALQLYTIEATFAQINTGVAVPLGGPAPSGTPPHAESNRPFLPRQRQHAEENHRV